MRLDKFTVPIQVSVYVTFLWLRGEPGPKVVLVQIYFNMSLITIYFPACDFLELRCLFGYGFSETFLRMPSEAFQWGSSDLWSTMPLLCLYIAHENLCSFVVKHKVFVIIAFLLCHQYLLIIGNVTLTIIYARQKFSASLVHIF